ncbi:fimbrial biogenesis chaperone [Acinetobacter gerneri]|uniref:Pili assembly chaperone N-terminal domain-containing protein n=1 Tax=Acinetobacter gerneri DSM 14967 = CIP 107464 = MTCC 9824 TaxID=1120926 RepID=N8ZMG8_9GAMM|nr:molecular chaperone [Acinetobacter gerneri]ENV32695.1 hypothetical protein F960_03202 [Acinetobacter gerneri DSM 14967 = CIP 107464 = MTCC 9824]EPR81666.1 pili assembly chaperone [Acinetobacter gerneri DSM 14967 = CIP 107464 = MTCC 9824]
MKKHSIALMLFILHLIVISNTNAGLVPSATRVIHQQEDPSQILLLANSNPYPIITQIWTDQGERNPESTHTPFVITPAIFKMQVQEIKSIKIIYNQDQLATDRESVFWLNLYEVPMVERSKLQEDHLNLAMNTQMKIFFRPKSLKEMSIDQRSKNLLFDIITQENQQQLSIENHSAFHITMLNIKLKSAEGVFPVDNTNQEMLAPFEKISINLKQFNISNIQPNEIEYTLIDDQGIKNTYIQKII